jgi:DNA-binding MarR family transcriptional regulator
MDRTTLTAALKPLERRGLVAISPDPKDRRSRRIGLTAAGHATLAAALPIWQRTHALVEDSLAGSATRLRGDLRALVTLDTAPARSRPA